MAAAKPQTKPPPGAGLHAVFGTDESEVKRAASELAARLTPPGNSDFGREVIDGAVAYVDDAVARIHSTIEALLTFPFMGGEKLVWLKSATFLADDQMGRSESVAAALEKLAAVLAGGIPPGTQFLFSAIGVDRRRTFYKGFAKQAKVLTFDKLDSSKSGWEEDAAPLVRALSKEQGLSFTGEALELFIYFTAGERRNIANELEKLDLYLGAERRQVNLADVKLLVPPSRAGIVFELGNAIARRELEAALSLLNELLIQGEKAIGILIVAIIPTVRNLLLAKDLALHHKFSRSIQAFQFGKVLEKLPAAAIAHLPRKKDGTISSFQLGLVVPHVHRFECDHLRAAFAACLDVNVQLVTSGLDAEVAMSQLLVRIIGRT